MFGILSAENSDFEALLSQGFSVELFYSVPYKNQPSAHYYDWD